MTIFLYILSARVLNKCVIKLKPGHMNKKMLLVIVCIVVFAVILTFVITEKTDNNTDTGALNEDPIVMGVVLPLSGDSANYGLEAKNALELAKNEINSSGGIDNRSVVLVYEDGRCDPKEAVKSANKLINVDDVKIVIGEACSGATIAIVEALSQKNILVFSPISTSPELTGISTLFIRNSPSDALAAKKTAELAIGYGLNFGSIIHEQTDFAKALSDNFVKEFARLGGSVLLTEKFVSGETDFRSQLTKIKNSESRFVYLVPQHPSTGAELIKQFRELKISQKPIGNEYYSDKSLLSVARGAANGVEFYVASNPSGKKTDEFTEKYKNEYGVDVNILQYTPNAYDVLYILKEAIERVGYDNNEIGRYVRSVENYEGAGGTYSFYETGDVEKGYTLMRVENNEAKVVE